MDEHTNITSFDQLLASLVAWTEVGAEIVDHMKRYAEHAPVETTRTEALASVFASALAPIADRHAAADIEAAAAVMSDALGQLEDEVLLVEPRAFDDEPDQ